MKNPYPTLVLLLLFTALSSSIAFAQCTPPGDPAVFGDHVWNVYAWNAGGAADTGASWNTNYSGYYVDTNTNLHTDMYWGNTGSPSVASGYMGCTVDVDNHSWSAKRRGFPCGTYVIDVVSHDDEGQLFVNGMKVWEHTGCCDTHNNAWTGYLDDTSTVVFQCTEGTGGSNGLIDVKKNPITLLGPSIICPGFFADLTAAPSDSYSWNTGETTPTMDV